MWERAIHWLPWELLITLSGLLPLFLPRHRLFQVPWVSLYLLICSKSGGFLVCGLQIPPRESWGHYCKAPIPLWVLSGTHIHEATCKLHFSDVMQLP